MELSGKKINFLGDSITQGCCATVPEKGFVEMMKTMYGLAESRNYGIGGTRIARQLGTYDWTRSDGDFCSRYAEMDADTDIILVFGGTNDHGHGDAPFGCDTDRTADTFSGACHVLFSGLQYTYPQATIVVATPLHRAEEGLPKEGSGKLLRDYVDVIRSTAAQYHIPVLDLFETSAINLDTLDALTTDGLHPNDAGHRILAEEIGAFLQAL